MHKHFHVAALIFSLLSLLLVGVNAAYLSSNRAKVQQISNNSQQLQAVQVFTRVYQSLANDLGKAAKEKKDSEIRGLLMSNGLQLREDAAPSEPTKKR
ncbi:MAG: hypothetical protein EBZ69_05500 [Alphaproteobacteria bacterium]|nr:hypothetical protein [Alphaproteobacteria bacterium]NDC56247.1 hypothetical protein [Alphaproteobacteria bacterium]NDG04890.1 hypothetical protein [Alphaproteobacteria bacterium]